LGNIHICHAPEDLDAAQSLGRDLEARGHRLSYDSETSVPRPDRLVVLRFVDCVIVMWTQASVGLEAVEEVAREALRFNLLIPVRAGSLAAERIPFVFRKLHMPLLDDADGVLRVLDHLRPTVFAEPSPPEDHGVVAEAPANVKVTDTLRFQAALTGEPVQPRKRTLGVPAVPAPVKKAGTSPVVWRLSLALGSVAGTALLIAATRQLWWPGLYAVLQSWGVLG
jgi:hypothetical protein